MAFAKEIVVHWFSKFIRTFFGLSLDIFFICLVIPKAWNGRLFILYWNWRRTYKIRILIRGLIGGKNLNIESVLYLKSSKNARTIKSSSLDGVEWIEAYPIGFTHTHSEPALWLIFILLKLRWERQKLRDLSKFIIWTPDIFNMIHSPLLLVFRSGIRNPYSIPIRFPVDAFSFEIFKYIFLYRLQTTK